MTPTNIGAMTPNNSNKLNSLATDSANKGRKVETVAKNNKAGQTHGPLVNHQ